MNAKILSTRIAGLVLGAAVIAMGAPASAQSVWEEIRPAIFQERAINPAGDLVALNAPYRTMTDLRTVLGGELRAPFGHTIRSVILVIDNNPMPVSAVFRLERPVPSFRFSAEMRINGPTPVRVVLETDDGSLYMTERFVKTSGVGACSAPPGADPLIALETLGQMELTMASAAPGESVAARLASLAGSSSTTQMQEQTADARLAISHPSHSGLQMDQITLLYIPARFVEAVQVEADGASYFTMTGSISLSENPAITFALPTEPSGLKVYLRDTEGAEFVQEFPLVQG